MEWPSAKKEEDSDERDGTGFVPSQVLVQRSHEHGEQGRDHRPQIKLEAS
jgi:hypothetical protein